MMTSCETINARLGVAPHACPAAADARPFYDRCSCGCAGCWRSGSSGRILDTEIHQSRRRPLLPPPLKNRSVWSSVIVFSISDICGRTRGAWWSGESRGWPWSGTADHRGYSPSLLHLLLLPAESHPPPNNLQQMVEWPYLLRLLKFK